MGLTARSAGASVEFPALSLLVWLRRQRLLTGTLQDVLVLWQAEVHLPWVRRQLQSGMASPLLAAGRLQVASRKVAP